MIYKRGNTWWYSFIYKGQHVQKSTGIKVKGVRADAMRSNRDVASDIEAARRTQLAKGEVGIEEKPAPTPIPTLKEFKTTFMDWVRSEKTNEGTQTFYETCFDRLVEFKEMADLPLDEIDEPIIEKFKLSAIEGTSPATVNRYLATLRKALRYAWRKLRLFDRMPVIELYTNERQREFVFTDLHNIRNGFAWP